MLLCNTAGGAGIQGNDTVYRSLIYQTDGQGNAIIPEDMLSSSSWGITKRGSLGLNSDGRHNYVNFLGSSKACIVLPPNSWYMLQENNTSECPVPDHGSIGNGYFQTWEIDAPSKTYNKMLVVATISESTYDVLVEELRYYNLKSDYFGGT